LCDNAGARGTSFATYIKDQCSSSKKSKANASGRKLEATQTTAEEIMDALLTLSRTTAGTGQNQKLRFCVICTTTLEGSRYCPAGRSSSSNRPSKSTYLPTKRPPTSYPSSHRP